MDWIRRNFIAFVVLAAIVLSFAYNLHETNVAEERARADNIASCVRANTRSALTAAWQRQAVENARNESIQKAYTEFARGSEAYLAIARYVDNPTRATQTQRVVLVDGTPARVLTREAEKLVAKGCHRAFHGGEGDLPEAPPIGVKRVVGESRNSG